MNDLPIKFSLKPMTMLIITTNAVFKPISMLINAIVNMPPSFKPISMLINAIVDIPSFKSISMLINAIVDMPSFKSISMLMITTVDINVAVDVVVGLMCLGLMAGWVFLFCNY
jgi:hypothetical protein